MTITKPTFDDYVTAARAVMQFNDPRLSDFSQGSVLSILSIVHAMAAEQSTAVSLAEFRNAYVATASGPTANDATDYLQRRIVDYGGPARPVATAATAEGELQRGTYVGAYTLVAGTEWRGTRPDGSQVIFEVVADVTLGISDAYVAFTGRCTATGRDGNVAAATLNRCPSIPSTLVVVQQVRASGGAEDLTDEQYRALFALYREAQTPGTVAALRYGALLVDGVRFATVDEAYMRAVDGGFVAVYIGDPDAGSDSALVAEVIDSLTDWRAAGTDVRVYGAARDELDFTLTVKMRAGTMYDATSILNAWITYLDEIEVGTTLYLSAGEAAIHERFGSVLLSCDIIADATPTLREIAPSAIYRAIRTADDGTGVTVALTLVA